MLEVAQTTKNFDTAPLFSVANSAERRRAEAWLESRIKQGTHTVFSEQVELTPSLAELLLGRNPDNRAIKDVQVDKLAADIKEGMWANNGESLKLSRDGFLNDGQHRCSAVVKSGRSIVTMVTFGLERDSRTTLDQGTGRTAGDFLSMDGVASGNHAASIASMVWQYDHHKHISHARYWKPTKLQITETFHNNPEIADSIRAGHRKGSAKLGGVSVLGFCHFVICRKAGASDADQFIGKMFSGENLGARDPILVCRERLTASFGPSKLRVTEKVEIILKAWNAHRQGRKLSIIRIEHGELPEVVG